jgi:protein-tyrosine-phosphatase
MAEALAKRRYIKHASFQSAGLHPQNPEDCAAAVDTLQHEFGIHVAGFIPRGLQDIDLSEFSDVIAMDSEIASELRSRTSRDFVVWNIKDPWEGNLAEYKRSVLQILRALADFIESTQGGTQ